MTRQEIIKNISGYLVAFIALGSWATFNYKTSSELLDKKGEFEKYKSETILNLQEKELQLNAEKKQIEVLREQLAAKVVDSKNELKIASYKEANVFESLRQHQPHIQRVKEEKYIQDLMKQYAALGVDLGTQPLCNDLESMKRYNQAKAIMSEISNRVQAIGLYDKYSIYLNSNYSTTFQGCR